MLSALSFIVLHSPIVAFCLAFSAFLNVFCTLLRKENGSFVFLPKHFYFHFPQNIVPLQRVVAAARLSDCRPKGGGVRAVSLRWLRRSHSSMDRTSLS
jgi:hypothetical protein